MTTIPFVFKHYVHSGRPGTILYVDVKAEAYINEQGYLYEAVIKQVYFQDVPVSGLFAAVAPMFLQECQQAMLQLGPWPFLSQCFDSPIQ